ncbi:TspO/MBR family protein [Halobacillus sp. A5]|uniref:TspO/MBR family protein n=1 Tax=Halobacillus sp. A5 TaxID=2880263 RepID=UPI0020A6A462|nr:tryptophan-rich sensory protein [Halobacillus sp. A5]MCP3028294.1 tryptophan-rich sensory protein [Halobacillus sp. A5]
MRKLFTAALSFILIYISFSVAGFLFPIDQSWYNQLDKPCWTPAGGSIGIIWGVLFGLISLALSIIVYRYGYKEIPKSVWFVLLMNYVFNQLFSYFQFIQKDLLLASIDCVLVAVTSLWLTILLFKKNRISGSLLIPYVVWSSFATVLAFTIYSLNPGMTALF